MFLFLFFKNKERNIVKKVISDGEEAVTGMRMWEASDVPMFYFLTWMVFNLQQLVKMYIYMLHSYLCSCCFS